MRSETRLCSILGRTTGKTGRHSRWELQLAAARAWRRLGREQRPSTILAAVGHNAVDELLAKVGQLLLSDAANFEQSGRT